jgi:hypothetical protein
MKTVRRYTQGILFGGIAEYLYRVDQNTAAFIVLLAIGAGIMYDIISSFGDED